MTIVCLKEPLEFFAEIVSKISKASNKTPQKIR